MKKPVSRPSHQISSQEQMLHSEKADFQRQCYTVTPCTGGSDGAIIESLDKIRRRIARNRAEIDRLRLGTRIQIGQNLARLTAKADPLPDLDTLFSSDFDLSELDHLGLHFRDHTFRSYGEMPYEHLIAILSLNEANRHRQGSHTREPS